MALNDDYYDVRAALNRLLKNKLNTLAAFERLMHRMDELEKENEQLRASNGTVGAEYAE